MRLFTLDSTYQVELNKEWIMLIPAFAALLKRDKGSEGDYRGQKKLKAKKELTFIYFDLDFASPLREYDEFERREKALEYAELKESDLDEAVMAAHAEYENLLLNSSRSLKTYRAVQKSLDALDTYFEDIDFNAVNNKGELLHNSSTYMMNIKRLDEAYTAIDRFRKRVEEELSGTPSIRGNASLGRREAKFSTGEKRDTRWQEGGNTVEGATKFEEMGSILGNEIDLDDEEQIEE